MPVTKTRLATYAPATAPMTIAADHARRSRILVIEDDALVRAELEAALDDYGFAPFAVENGHRGLQRALDGEFDAIVLDRMLPDIDGLSILSTLRNIGRTTPVLILSALSAVDERVRGLRAGGDDYVTKPFDALEMTARLNALLRRRSGPLDSSLLCVGDLSVDPHTREVRRAGQLLDVKPREYSLLEYLMRHAGQVVTRAMLFEAVWNYSYNAQTNVIDMHIGQLRKRLSCDGALPPMIRTVRNAGYILHAAD